MANKLIELKNVSKTYMTGDIKTQVLKNVNFTIDEGELVVILGASGAGKSTILNLIGGLENPTSGEILVDGKDISKMKENELTKYRAEKIGFVFQFYNLIANLTALENVEFASESVKDKLDAKEVMKKVGLQDKLGSFSSQMSGGEQQRVAIARAIAKNPRVLLCDEPTGALDYVNSKAILGVIEEMSKETKKCIILITHNNAIAEMADKVIHVKSGEIESVVINQNKRSVKEIEW